MGAVRVHRPDRVGFPPRDPPAVRRPHRPVVLPGRAVASKATKVRSVGTNGEEVETSVDDIGKGDPTAVRGPGCILRLAASRCYLVRVRAIRTHDIETVRNSAPRS